MSPPQCRSKASLSFGFISGHDQSRPQLTNADVCAGAGAHRRSLGFARDDKGKAALPCTAAKGTLGREEGGVLVSAYLATTIYGSVTLPFVIPSEAKGSAVRPGSRTNIRVTHRH